MATGSLVVRISADINDFSRQLHKMTKDVTRAGEKLAGIGMSLTAGITAPVIASALALGKFGMEAQETGRRMDRQFGAAADSVTRKLELLMKVVPETKDELKEMAMTVSRAATGMGMGTRQAAAFSVAMVQMAGDLAAVAGTSTQAAMSALEKAIGGKTKALRDFGINITNAQIKQEAYRLGILGLNRELTPLGTNLATYSLLVKQSSNFQGAATNRLKDAAHQWRMMKAELKEMASVLGEALLPAFQVIIGILRELVHVIAQTPPWLIKTMAVMLAIAAAVGPLIVLISKLVVVFNVLRAAVTLLMGKVALGGLLAALANPAVAAAVIALGAAIAGIIYLWRRYSKAKKEATEKPPEMPELPSVEDLMGGITDMEGGNPLEQWQRHVSLLRTELERAVRVGDRWGDSYEGLLTVQQEALKGMMDNIGKTNEWAEAYAKVYDEVTAIINQLQLMEVLKMDKVNFAGGVNRASRVSASDTQLDFNVANNAIQAETQLRLRERTLALADTFQATRVATVELGEAQRRASQDLAVAASKFKIEWSNIGESAKTGANTFMSGLLSAFGPIALLLKALGAVLDGLMPFIDALLVPLVELGRVIGIMLTPILKILFVPLKYLAIIVAFLGEVIARVAAGISTAIGRAVYGIGKAIDSLPFVSAKGIMRAGEAMLDFAEDQYRTADELKKARKEIQRLTFGETEDSLNGLAGAADNVTEALLNVPQGFKVALERFRAQLPGERPRAPDTGEGGPDWDDDLDDDTSTPQIGLTKERKKALWDLAMSGGGSIFDKLKRYEEYVRNESRNGYAGTAVPGGSMTVNVQIDGKTVAKAVVGSLQERAQQDFGSTARWSEVQY